MAGFFKGNYRLFLASYVLVGITLAIYSRNALSLAAVGMIASNVAQAELARHQMANSSIDSYLSLQLDGTCPRQGAHIVQTPLIIPDLSVTPNWHNSSIEQRIKEGQLVNWSAGEQGLIFAAGSLGNLFIAIPITRIGEIYGTRWIIFVSLLAATLQAALMPLISPYCVSVVFLFQLVLCGLSFGADCVAYTMFVRWLTKTELAFFVSCLLICYQLGSIISNAITGRILAESADWRWSFYTPAILCGLWTIGWIPLSANEPYQCRLVSGRELALLACQNKTSADQFRGSSNSKTISTGSISWLKLARDPNVWAIVGVKFTLRWYFSVHASYMPTYLSSVAHLPVDTIGHMGVFQSVVCLVSGLLTGYLTRSIATHRPLNISLANFRKLAQSIVNFGLAASLIVFLVFDCNKWVTLASLTFGGMAINFYVAAALQLPLDLSPDHCGLITSIGNTLALGQVIGAPVSGLILDSGPHNRAHWRVVWSICIILNVLSGLMFILLVDSKRKDYNQKTSLTLSLPN